MNEYKALKDKHQAEVNAFPMFFAFNNAQFDRGMKELGLEPGDTGQIYKLGNTGGYYRRSDAGRFHEMLDRHSAEMEAAISADKTGNGFIFQMFCYELANHEYIITGDVSDALDALGLTADDVNASKNLQHGLKLAIKTQQKGGF